MSVFVSVRLLFIDASIVSDVRLPFLDMESGYRRTPRKTLLELMSRMFSKRMCFICELSFVKNNELNKTPYV